MIISKSPFRISMGGGGSDLPSYYKKYGGFLIAGTIDKHIYVGANQQFYKNYSLKYSQIEIVNNKEDIKHNLIREAIKYLDIDEGIEITSLADIPGGTGLGSSGAFLTALLNTLHNYKDKPVSKRQIAEEACKIELEVLKEYEGKQDPYACAFGGLKAYKFERNGSVQVIPLANEDIIMDKLERHLILFYTGIQRKGKASDVLKEQDIKTKANDESTISFLHEIKDIGMKSRDVLQQGDFNEFGRLLDKHWQLKKQYSNNPKDNFIDNCYQTAIKNGALGGKIMGADSTTGFFIFYYPKLDFERFTFIKKMENLGLQHMPFKFDTEGVVGIIEEER